MGRCYFVNATDKTESSVLEKSQLCSKRLNFSSLSSSSKLSRPWLWRGDGADASECEPVQHSRVSVQGAAALRPGRAGQLRCALAPGPRAS